MEPGKRIVLYRASFKQGNTIVQPGAEKTKCKITIPGHTLIGEFQYRIREKVYLVHFPGSHGRKRPEFENHNDPSIQW